MILVSRPANNPPVQVAMPVLDWQEGGWVPKLNAVIPTPNLLNIATRVATNLDVISLRAPGTNSSFTYPLTGPYVQSVHLFTTPLFALVANVYFLPDALKPTLPRK